MILEYIEWLGIWKSLNIIVLLLFLSFLHPQRVANHMARDTQGKGNSCERGGVTLSHIRESFIYVGGSFSKYN